MTVTGLRSTADFSAKATISDFTSQPLAVAIGWKTYSDAEGRDQYFNDIVREGDTGLHMMFWGSPVHDKGTLAKWIEHKMLQDKTPFDITVVQDDKKFIATGCVVTTANFKHGACLSMSLQCKVVRPSASARAREYLESVKSELKFVSTKTNLIVSRDLVEEFREAGDRLDRVIETYARVQPIGDVSITKEPTDDSCKTDIASFLQEKIKETISPDEFNHQYTIDPTSWAADVYRDERGLLTRTYEGKIRMTKLDSLMAQLSWDERVQMKQVLANVATIDLDWAFFKYREKLTKTSPKNALSLKIGALQFSEEVYQGLFMKIQGADFWSRFIVLGNESDRYARRVTLTIYSEELEAVTDLSKGIPSYVVYVNVTADEARTKTYSFVRCQDHFHQPSPSA